MHLHHHSLNTKLDANADADGYAHATCKQTFRIIEIIFFQLFVMIFGRTQALFSFRQNQEVHFYDHIEKRDIMAKEPHS